MLSSRRQPIQVALLAADAAVSAVSLLVAYELRRSVLGVYFPDLWPGDLAPAWIYILLLLASTSLSLAVLRASGGYELGRLTSLRAGLTASLRALGATAIAILATSRLLQDQTVSRSVLALFLAFAATGFFLNRVAARAVLARRAAQRSGLIRTAIVGTGPAARRLHASLSARPYLGYDCAGFIAAPGAPDEDPSVATLGEVAQLVELAERLVLDEVFFATPLEYTARHETAILALEEVGRTIHLRGDVVGGLVSRTFVGEFDGMPILTLRSTPADPVALAIKRLIDLVVASTGLVLAAPLFAATALAIRLHDGGPVLFLQERVGLNGRRFRMAKFRSMAIDAEARRQDVAALNEMDGPVFKSKDDPRVTPIGRWIRRYSIDELPQLWNVLVGQMSLVGPRPPIPGEVVQYARWQRRRLSMKPGLTCLWQVSGRNDIDFETWMRLDMEYIDSWSLALDLKILARTVPAVLLARGSR